MSRTYCIVCHDCKERLWIGQSGPQIVQVYRGEEPIKLLNTFFAKHEFHRLEFGDDEHMESIDDYVDADPVD